MDRKLLIMPKWKRNGGNGQFEHVGIINKNLKWIRNGENYGDTREKWQKWRVNGRKVIHNS